MTRKMDDRAISVVVGAILVAAALFATLVVFRLTYVPVWEERAEAEHMGLVERQLVEIRGELDRQIDNRTTVPVTHPLALAREGSNIILPTPSNQQVSYGPGVRTFVVSTTFLRVDAENGRSHAGVNESWNAVSGNTSMSNIASIENLRVRFDSIGSANDGDVFAITLQNATNHFAGDVVFTVRARAIGFDLDARVHDARGTTIFEQPVAAGVQGTHAPYWMDVLNSGIPWSALVAEAGGPMTLSLETRPTDMGAGNADFTAEYAMAYRRAGAKTDIVLGGAGSYRPDFTSAHSGYALTYTGTNTRYVDQTFILEHGALIVNQSAGSVLKVNPHFVAERVGNITALEIALPNLGGQPGGLAGSTTTTLTTRATSHSTWSGTAPDLFLTVESVAPELWATMWREALDGVAGFAEGTHYTVATNATHATLTVYGVTSTPGSLVDDLYVRFTAANIDLELER